MFTWSCWGWKRFERNLKLKYLISSPLSPAVFLFLCMFLPVNSSLVSLSTTWNSSQSQRVREERNPRLALKKMQKMKRLMILFSPVLLQSDTQDTSNICLFRACRPSQYALSHTLHIHYWTQSSKSTSAAHAKKKKRLLHIHCSWLDFPGARFQLLPFRSYTVFYASACLVHKKW